MFENKKFVWLVETEPGDGGTPVTGTLVEYAKSWEQAYLSGDFFLSPFVLTWTRDAGVSSRQVHVTSHPPTEDGYLPREFSVEGFSGSVTLLLDGAA
jgi:hypothetical protein